ncbi:MAG: DUF1552 domain-containing protein [Myxococcota bacterium]
MDFDRRTFLKSALGASAASALFDWSLARRAWADPMRNLVCIYLPDGFGDFPDWHIGRNFESPGSLSASDLRPNSVPLAPVVHRVTLVDGLKMYAGRGHEAGLKVVLNGAPGNRHSLDVEIGQNTNTTYPYVVLGIGSRFQGRNDGLTVENGQSVDAVDNPTAYLASLGVSDPSSDASATRDPRLTDMQLLAAHEVALRQAQRLMTRLRGVDRSNMEVTIEAMEAERNRIQARLEPSEPGSPPTVTGCDPNEWDIPAYGDSGYPRPYHQENVRMEVADQQFQLAKLSLQCNLTRVVNIHWGHKVSNFNDWHNKSHGQWQAYTDVRRPVMSQIASWIQELERDGMLDRTLVLGYSELGHSNAHDNDRMPFFLAGGGLGNGRALDYRGTNRVRNAAGESETHTKLLVSVAHWMGLTDKMSHGYSDHGVGPLEGL